MTEDQYTAAPQREAGTRPARAATQPARSGAQPARSGTQPGSSRTHREVLDRVLQTARSDHYEGYSKHAGLNSPVLARLAGKSRLRRLCTIQVGTRHPGGIPAPVRG